MADHLLAYDVVERRPGCVIVAVALGADRQAALRFPSESWLLVPTPDMRVYRVTEEQLQKIVRQTAISGNAC